MSATVKPFSFSTTSSDRKNDFRAVSLAVLGGINLRMPEAYRRTIVRALAIISSQTPSDRHHTPQSGQGCSRAAKPTSSARHLCISPIYGTHSRNRGSCVRVHNRSAWYRRSTMGLALEINFALWIMIGCAIEESSRLAACLY